MTRSRENSQINVLDLKNASSIRNGDHLRNINSYEYLKNIWEKGKGVIDFPPFDKLKEIFEKDEYNPEFPYGDNYTSFLTAVDDSIEKIEATRGKLEIELKAKKSDEAYAALIEGLDEAKKKLSEEVQKLEGIINAIDEMLDCIYNNPNHAIERSAEMIKDVMVHTSHTSPDIESEVRKRMEGQPDSESHGQDSNFFVKEKINKTTPQQQGSKFGRLKAMMSDTFKPQMTTNIASVRVYQYQDSRRTEYRFGTQGQIHEGHARVSPMFSSWLKLQQRKRENSQADTGAQKTRITHIYFNNLGLDRTGKEGNRERALTLELHRLESDHPNVAVITLPADKGLMDRRLLEQHGKQNPYEGAFDKMLRIATGNDRSDIEKDFFISDDIKKILYGEDGGRYDAHQENLQIRRLLNQSFEALGFQPGDKLSPAEMQAVYFHFIKFELTNFIIEKLQPDSFNMSCKDAIDRGGVSSAYYNLMKSIELDNPINKEEFYRALHGAPTLVKGRGMNHHSRLIWNAVNTYLNANPTIASQLDWLVTWRDKHAPKSSREHIIEELNDYIRKKPSESKANFSSLFFAGKDNTTKRNAAVKLLTLLKDPENKETLFETKELAALNDARLSKIRKKVEELGLIDPSKFTKPPVKFRP